MSFVHKAYQFDWSAFTGDTLFGLLQNALSTGDVSALEAYIESHYDDLKDPYEGEPLPENWRVLLENHDVHEYGEFALTRFYDPAQEQGLRGYWSTISGQLLAEDQKALLGVPFVSSNACFDPGRQGAYFQTPEQTVHSLERVCQFHRAGFDKEQREIIQGFETFLIECIKTKRGIYVTF